MQIPLLQFAAEETAQKSGLAVLGIDPLAFLLQLVTFLLLFILLKRFAFKKIIGMLEERRRTIDKGVELGRKMETEQQELQLRVDQALHEARLEADKIITAGRQEAAIIIRQAEESALRRADTMLAEAKARIQEDIERARLGLRKETADLVAEAVEVIIEERLDAKKDAGLIERALRKARA